MLAGLTALGTVGCKDFLETEPLARMDQNSAFSNYDYVQQGVNAMYDPLGWEKTYSVSYWVFGDCLSDDSEIGGFKDDQPETQDLMLFNTSSYNARIDEFYRFLHIGIQRTNTLLDATAKFEDVDYSKEDYDKFRGQAHFLRALYYFDLVKVFGPVPYIGTNIANDDAKNLSNRQDNDADGSKQVEFVLGEIIKDLELAAGELPAAWPAGDAGRATKGSANGLLAKVYAFYASYKQYGVYKFDANPQPLWNKCIAAADRVINSGKHGLIDDYHTLYTLEGENSMESLFEIQHVNGESDGTEYEGTFRNIYQMFRTIKGKVSKSTAMPGYGWNVPRQDYVSIFDLADADGKAVADGWQNKGNYSDWDPRLDLIAKADDTLIWNFGSVGPEGATIEVNASGTGGSCTGYWSRKTELPYDKWGGNSQASGLNYTLLRYADVLLLKAEALVETGKAGEALDIVNEIRTRARNSNRFGKGDLPADLTSVNIETVREERRRELGLEGHRFFDIVRWGVADEIFKDVKFDSYKRAINYRPGVSVRLPIPNRAISECSGSLIQNYGY